MYVLWPIPGTHQFHSWGGAHKQKCAPLPTKDPCTLRAALTLRDNGNCPQEHGLGDRGGAPRWNTGRTEGAATHSDVAAQHSQCGGKAVRRTEHPLVSPPR